MLPATALIAIAPAAPDDQAGTHAVTADHKSPNGFTPIILPASDEGEQAIARFKVPEGLILSLFAAEPMLANPVALAIDPKGKFYVVETFRHSQGVTDNRSHMVWLDDDLAIRTVADRVAMYRKYLGEQGIQEYSEADDRLRLIEDTDGDGKADRATVFADGFTSPETGLGAGVLPVGEDVWYTCIPDLWRLRDTNGDGQADERQAVATGFGLHVAFLGHDLHGLIVGPDGRLYFSLGDRGLNVTTFDGRKLSNPDSGAVLRCDLDGRNMEIVATGLRNPQELAFDEQGNLFTVDNNSDSGDKARLVHLVEGGDSGWRIGWQFIEQPNSRGPWNSEKMWEPRNADQPAFLLPPLINLSDGPSGLAYNPGTALRGSERGRFFLADFRGTASQSGIRSFSVKPAGASFELADQNQFVWGMAVTDVAFGPDGALYATDWVNGWDKPGKGRIYKLTDPGDDATRAATARLIREGMTGRPVPELFTLLDHDDMRVRQAAQFELVNRVKAEMARPQPDGTRSSPTGKSLWVAALGQKRVADGAAGAEPLRVRRHAIWALGQLARGRRNALVGYPRLLADSEPEIRKQTARVLGDLIANDRGQSNAAEALQGLTTALTDDEPSVRFEAALALGKLGRAESIAPLASLLEANNDADAYLRHAAVMGLAGTKDAAGIAKLGTSPSAAVRLGSLLALRRLGSPLVANYLKDADPKIVVEAARAINDAPIGDATAALAALDLPADAPAALARRVLNANVRLGGAAAATRLAALAGNPTLDERVRAEAIDALATWAKPQGRDRVVGLWRPVAERPAADAIAALGPKLDGLLADTDEPIRRATLQAVARLGLKDAGSKVATLAANRDLPLATRVDALKALDAIGDPSLPEAVKAALADDNSVYRAEGLQILAKLEPEQALPSLETVLGSGDTAERQIAFNTLATLKGSGADALLATWIDKLSAGEVPAEVQLDLLEAAGARQDSTLKSKLDQYQAAKPQNDPTAPYREALVGGDARRGEQIFRQKTEVYCLRCHKVGGRGGEVGPELTELGGKKDRAYILESIVNPNAQIAEGFETTVVATEDGRLIAGVLKAEDDNALKLMTAEARLIEIPKAEIEERRRGDSAMPSDLIKKLSKRELRDLIEYLARGGAADR